MRSVIVLGTLHRLQGADKAFGNIDDPLYPILIRDLIEENSIEFVFEEGTGVTRAIDYFPIRRFAHLF